MISKSAEEHEYVDLGLPSGLLWATCNVGASSAEDYGDYFAWGETSPKNEYTAENSLTYGEQMSDISGNAQYDAAAANWGGGWRMPTSQEMQELVNYCEWEWTQVNGVYGSRVIGPNGSCIFLPAAGGRYGSSLGYEGGRGRYWSSTPNDYYGDDYACSLDFDSDGESVSSYYRDHGHTVRPVYNPQNEGGGELIFSFDYEKYTILQRGGDNIECTTNCKTLNIFNENFYFNYDSSLITIDIERLMIGLIGFESIGPEGITTLQCIRSRDNFIIDTVVIEVID